MRQVPLGDRNAAKDFRFETWFVVPGEGVWHRIGGYLIPVFVCALSGFGVGKGGNIQVMLDFGVVFLPLNWCPVPEGNGLRVLFNRSCWHKFYRLSALLSGVLGELEAGFVTAVRGGF